MNHIINKLYKEQKSFGISASTNGETIVTIPVYDGDEEIEIIKYGNYKVNIPLMKPYTPPETKTFQTEFEVMSYLFKEDSHEIR